MTVEWPNGSNDDLFASPADWISPNSGGGYGSDPPAATGAKVIVNDTDHIWGIGGDRVWLWKSFTRGLNVIYMDPWEGRVIPSKANTDLRWAIGNVRRFSMRLDLAGLVPVPNLASTGYCLANTVSDVDEYVVYLPPFGDGARSRVRRKLYSWVAPWV